MERLQQTCLDSVKLTLERKRQLRITQQEQDRLYVENQNKTELEIQKREAEEKLSHRKSMTDLHSYHKKQIDEKQKILEAGVQEELREHEQLQRQKDKKDKIFNSWAEQCIGEWKHDGKDISVLIKGL